MNTEYSHYLVSRILRHLFAALLAWISFSSFAQFSSCNSNDPAVKFSDGAELCMSSISFFTKPGFIESRPSQTFIDALKYYPNYAISATNDPQMCPFVQSTEFRSDQSVDTLKLTQDQCSERLKKAIKKHGRISEVFECKCNVILKNGMSPLTKVEFLSKTDSYAKQVLAGYKALNDFKPTEVASNTREQTDRKKVDESIRIQPNLIPDNQLKEPVLPAISASYTDKIALVIGNSNYISQPLRNPINDAKAIATKLIKNGFKVTYYQDMKTNQISFILNDIVSKIKLGSVFAFFYAGHGYQIKGQNYFPAIDAKIKTEYDVPLQSLSLSGLMDMASDAKSALNLIMLDACRNNPFTVASRGGTVGLARIDLPASGTMIFYATRPGSVAADGEDDNGLYTKFLLKYLDTPNLPIEKFFKLVTNDVKNASNGGQVPWIEGSIDGEFAFN